MAAYRVMVDDNFHYMDPDSRWELGVFDSAEAAIDKCRRMVDADLEHNYRPGMSAEALLQLYTMYSEDPFIVPVDGAPAVEFSAWDYARERCAAICGQAPASEQ